MAGSALYPAFLFQGEREKAVHFLLGFARPSTPCRCEPPPALQATLPAAFSVKDCCGGFFFFDFLGLWFSRQAHEW
jgi:hypothetical protein